MTFWQVSELKGVGRVAEPLGVCAITPGNDSDCGGEKRPALLPSSELPSRRFIVPANVGSRLSHASGPRPAHPTYTEIEARAISPNAGQFE